ncbi:hypothetical protein P8V03_13100 [Clostridium sp. A1-XYC3]|uniref:Uncharacterized protein n=1 Tax=Clostridium tanneri TaxID=3037988 RepID=A0ABU4JVY5_9CLOT|nr:hypothetical protein [Clostridium sp. A1-XYC3]MDW8802088.1 hypothetical protein [Clostridium sp. A1-XYC3]
MAITFVIIGYGILFMIDGYPVLKEYKLRKFLPYAIIFLIAFISSCLIALEIRIPSPSEGIKKVIMVITEE